MASVLSAFFSLPLFSWIRQIVRSFESKKIRFFNPMTSKTSNFKSCNFLSYSNNIFIRLIGWENIASILKNRYRCEAPCAQPENNPIVILPGLFFFCWIFYLFCVHLLLSHCPSLWNWYSILLLVALLSWIEYENKKRICVVNKINFCH